MKLLITAGPDEGQTIEPSGERFTIGREGVDLELTDEEISRQHFELRTLPDGGLEIADLGSRNGTMVDGERISAPRALVGGEEIVVGVTTISVEAPPAPPVGETVVAGPKPTAVSAQPPPQPPADPDVTAPGVVPPPAEPPPAEEPPPTVAPPPAEELPPTVVPPPTTPAPPPPPAAAPPPPAQAPPPPPAPVAAARAPARPAGQASTGRRVTALVLSIIFVLVGLLALVTIAVAISVPLCDDPGRSVFEDCYDASNGKRVIASALLALGVIASIAFLVVSIQYFSSSRRPRMVLWSGIATLVLFIAGFAIFQ